MDDNTDADTNIVNFPGVERDAETAEYVLNPQMLRLSLGLMVQAVKRDVDHGLLSVEVGDSLTNCIQWFDNTLVLDPNVALDLITDLTVAAQDSSTENYDVDV